MRDVSSRVDYCAARYSERDHGDDEDVVEVCVASCQPTRQRDRGCADHAGGNVDERRLQRGKPKRLDNQIREILRSTVRDLCQDGDAENVPCFRVEETLACLIPAPGDLFRASCALDDCALGYNLFLFCVQEPSVGNTIRQEHKQHKPPEKRQHP